MQELLYIGYGFGFVLAAGFTIRYNTLTRGAWREHQAGVSFMGMAAAVGIAMLAAVLRILAVRWPGWSWLNEPTLVLGVLGLWSINVFLAHRWYLLERYQRSDKE